MFRLASCLAVLVLLVGVGGPTWADVIASAGFNDAAGMHSNPTPDSPYKIGVVVNGYGVGEPGWVAGGWGAGGYAPVQDAVVYEGDGALYVEGAGRHLAESLAGEFRIDQYVRFPAGGKTTARRYYATFDGTPVAPRVSSEWLGEAGKFWVVDGDGSGSLNYEDTGFTWTADTWYKVSEILDFGSDTWEFFVDNVKYQSPDPLGFRGTPPAMNTVQWFGAGMYLDAVTIVPEPSTIVLLFTTAVGLLVCGWRRRCD